jgi:hypothetical protein
MYFLNNVHEANLCSKEFISVHIFYTRNYFLGKIFILLHTDKLKPLFYQSPEMNLPYEILGSRGCE